MLRAAALSSSIIDITTIIINLGEWVRDEEGGVGFGVWVGG